MLKLKNISKSYGDTKIIDRLSLDIHEGAMVAITGRSGSGKTTLLNVLGLLDSIDSGSYSLNDKEIDFSNDKILSSFRMNDIGFIFQNYGLIASMNIFNNISLPLRFRGLSKKEIKSTVTYIAKDLDIHESLYKYPFQLSGGECQRVAIGRALVKNPKILLADEPTGALDEHNEAVVIDLLLKLNAKGITVIMVTHNLDIASKCGKILLMKNGKLN